MTDELNGAAPAATDDTTQPAPADDNAAPQANEPGDDAAATADDLAPAEPAKPRQTAKERIDELTAARRQAERDADYWRNEAQRHQPKAEAPKAETKADEEPNPANYTYGDTDAAYIKDAARYEARQTVRQEFAQERERDQLNGRLQSFAQRVTQQYPDGEPAGITALRRAQTLPQAVQEIILTSENGPKLADHLGANPGELGRLSALSAPLQAYELAKLETRLTATTQPKTLTTAPEPPAQVRGTGGQFKAAPDTDDFAAFDKAY